MTIEHSTISFGEIHPVANWIVTVGGVAALGGIPVGDGDIGKVAWVAGVGHYVLASTAPTVWESLGVTITDMTYDIPSETLSITLSDGTTHSVVIVAGLSESEVNALIADALDDYDTAIKTYIGESITSALEALTTANIPDSADRRYVSDAQLAVLGNTSGTNSGDETTASIKTKLGAASSTQDGYLTSADWSAFNGKQAALPDVLTEGAYGSSTQYPIITFNAKGIATGVTLQAVAAGDTVVSASSGTVTVAASTNYVILVSGSFTLDISALTGRVQLINVTAVQYTVTLTVGSKTVSDLTNSVITSPALNAFSQALLAVNPNVANSVRFIRPVQIAVNDMLWAANNSNASGSKISWSLLTLGGNRTYTLADKSVNFGDMSSVATTNSNTLSGTRTRILGGSSNTVDGTDNIVIGCSNANISSASIGIGGVVYSAVYNTGGILSLSYPKGSIVHGTSLHPLVVLFDSQSAYGGAAATTLGMCTVSLNANGSTNNITTDTAAPNNNNCPRLVAGYISGATLFAAIGSSVHDVEFIVTFGINTPLEPSRTFYAQRRVYAAYHYVSGTPTWHTSTATVGTDTDLGAVVGTVTVGFTLDTANNRLVPTVSATGGQNFQASVRVDSHYNRK